MLSVALLFFVCVALHARLYDLKPATEQLTRFYLVMSAGGALGGLFTALIAPLVFDWAWEHPLLVLGAAMLLPRGALPDWRAMKGLEPELRRLGLIAAGLSLGVLFGLLFAITRDYDDTVWRWIYTAAIMLIGLALVPWRGMGLLLLAMLMYVQGGFDTINDSRQGLRTRSYFGIYTVRDYPADKLRTLAHGTTLHGEQSTDPALRLKPRSYYGPGSGAGIAFGHAPALFGSKAVVAVIGLGTGTLACFYQPGQSWTLFEIDPAVLELSRNRTFTYLDDCAPKARIVLGDARIELGKEAPGSIDLLAVDAFSSDAIPLHLLTEEAIAVYLKALSPKGVLLVHISNRYIDLEPVLAGVVRIRGLHAAMRDDTPATDAADTYTGSTWIAISRDAGQVSALSRVAPQYAWTPLTRPAARVWSDDHASILPYIRWENFLGAGS
jgi:SAM-dependent methyltransferase